MLKIGLTGGIGTGKSSVTEAFQSLGAAVINADLLGHDAYLPGTIGFEEVVTEFGQEIVGSDGQIDRKKLGPIVFSDSSKMDRLNEIMHPLIRDLIDERLVSLESSHNKVAVVEAAILIEAGWKSLFDEIWVVISDREEVINRLGVRNGLSREDAVKRIDSQMSNNERIEHGDVVVENTGSMEDLQTRVNSLWSKRIST
jgi:phosphopantetheine adenylyltransferase/dephospho-CoA kinase